MKKLVAALAVLVIGTVTAGLLLRPRRDRQAPPAPEIAAPAQPASGRGAVDRLLGERTPVARLELVSLYAAWAKDPGRLGERRAMVHQIVAREEPATAIRMLTMAVAGDPVPLEADPLIGEVSQALAPLWKDAAMFAEGRDMLRLADHDKSRALLAASLTERATRPPAGMAEIPPREQHELASDLIQVNMHSLDRTLKAQTLAHVRAIAGDEVAEVLADPANAHNSQAARQSELARAAPAQER
jgi:hypothetical protein